MTDGKKILFGCILAIILFGAGILSGLAITKARDSAGVRQYLSTIESLEGQLRSQVNRGDELSVRFDEYRAEVREAQRQHIEAISGFVKEIAGYKERVRILTEGFTADIDAISGIERTVGSVIDKVARLGEPE